MTNRYANHALFGGRRNSVTFGTEMKYLSLLFIRTDWSLSMWQCTAWVGFDYREGQDLSLLSRCPDQFRMLVRTLTHYVLEKSFRVYNGRTLRPITHFHLQVHLQRNFTTCPCILAFTCIKAQ